MIELTCLLSKFKKGSGTFIEDSKGKKIKNVYTNSKSTSADRFNFTSTPDGKCYLWFRNVCLYSSSSICWFCGLFVHNIPLKNRFEAYNLPARFETKHKTQSRPKWNDQKVCVGHLFFFINEFVIEIVMNARTPNIEPNNRYSIHVDRIQILISCGSRFLYCRSFSSPATGSSVLYTFVVYRNLLHTFIPSLPK